MMGPQDPLMEVLGPILMKYMEQKMMVRRRVLHLRNAGLVFIRPQKTTTLLQNFIPKVVNKRTHILKLEKQKVFFKYFLLLGFLLDFFLLLQACQS